MPVDELKLVSCWEQGRLDSRVAPLTLTVHGMLLQGPCSFCGLTAPAVLCPLLDSWSSDAMTLSGGNYGCPTGCNFDGQKLSESLLDSAANSALGDCFFAWVPRTAPSPYPVRAATGTLARHRRLAYDCLSLTFRALLLLPQPYVATFAVQNGESVKVPLYSSGSRSDAIADVLLPSARHDVRRPTQFRCPLCFRSRLARC